MTIGQESAFILWLVHGCFALLVWCCVRLRIKSDIETIVLGRTIALAAGTAATLVTLLVVMVPPSLLPDNNSHPDVSTDLKQDSLRRGMGD